MRRLVRELTPRPHLLLALLVAAATLPASASSQAGEPAFQLPATNPPAVVRQRIASTDVEIAYNRPRVKGRPIFGSLVPYGEVWRTGSDSATRITFSTPVTLEGVPIAAGTYELFTIPGEEVWTVIVHEHRSQWGSYAYDQANDVARMSVRPEHLGFPVESFTISVDAVENAAATLNLSWERTRVPVSIEVDVRETVVAGLEEQLRSAARKPYFQAAMFYFENGLDLDRAAELIALALEVSPGHIGILHRQALILAEKGDVEGARAAARASLDGAQRASRELREEYTRLNTALLARISG